MEIIKKAQEIMNELTNTCPECLGYGEIPIMGTSGQWELTPCPKCSKKEVPSTSEPCHNTKEFDAVEVPEVSPKDEDGKTKMELLLDMPEQIEKLGKILTFGIKKYPTRMGWSTRSVDQYTGAILRHLLAWRKGQLIDPETGLPHILHVAINCMFVDFIQDKRSKESECVG